MTRRRANDPCWCRSGAKLKRCHGAFVVPERPVRLGRVSPMRAVPAGIERPHYIRDNRPGSDRGPVQVIDDADDLARLERACRVAAEVLAAAGAVVAAGVTTEQLDEVAHEAYVARGAYPSTLGYQGYTKSICTSVNEVVCHGIPDDRPLGDGDIVNVDVTAFVDGMHGDTSATFVVGQVTPPVAALVDSCREAMLRGIGALRAGGPLGSIGSAVQPHAFDRGLGVVADYGGHGIGRHFHASPHVDHVVKPGSMRVPDGLVITVEPMLTAGVPRHHQCSDGWTVITDDLLPTAQFEHTVIVEGGCARVLTVV